MTRIRKRSEAIRAYILEHIGEEGIAGKVSREFRVFAAEHPEVSLIPSHTNSDIMGLIQATIKAGRPGFKGTLSIDH